MSILSKLKQTFLPSQEVAAARRQKVFGSTSKTGAAVEIVGAAAAAIVAPVLVARAGGAKVVASSVASKVGSVIKANPIKSVVVGSVVAPTIAGSVVRDPTIVTRAPGEIASFEKNLYSVAKEPSAKNVKKLYSENPIIAGGLTAAGLVVAGKGAVGAATLASNALTASKLSKAAESTVIPSPAGQPALSTATSTNGLSGAPVSTAGASAASPFPVTPETTALTPRTGTSIARRKRHISQQVNRQSVRVQVINANHSRLQSYIRKRSY